MVILHRRSISNQTRTNELLADRYSKTIESRLNRNLDFINLLAIELTEGNLSESTFQHKVDYYLKNHPEFINITWVDSNFNIKSVAPYKANAHLIGLNIELPTPKKASRLAKEKKKPIYTQPFEAIQGGASFEVWCPIFIEDKFIGLFAGVYSSSKVLNSLTEPNKFPNSHFSLIDNKGQSITLSPKAIDNSYYTESKRPLTSLNNGVNLLVRSRITSPFNHVIIVIVILLYVLIFVIATTFFRLKMTKGLLKANETQLLKQNAELITANEKIEASEASFKAYTEQSPIAIYTTNVQGELIYANETWLLMTGISIEEALGNGWINSLHPDDKEHITKKWNKSIQSDGKWFYEYRFVNKNNQITWVEGTAKQLRNKDNELLGYLGSNLNITARKEAEQDLIVAKQKAEESERLKSAFLANMSHEIRTPMNGILGFTGLLKKADLSGEEQQKYIRIIEKSGDRLLCIINDILCFSKIESGLMQVNLEELNINDQINHIYNFFKPELDNKALQFTLKNKLSSSETFALTDQEKVLAILTNLVKNAIKYTEKGSIEFGCDLKSEKENSYFEFYVRDTGIGIPTDRQQAIFERFIQADIADKMALQGAGLGLSISKAYVEMLGGQIWVQSEEGVGSAFYFNIPYQLPSPRKIMDSDAAESETEENSIRNLKILIAEDDEASEILISLFIKEFGIETLIARTGTEAVEMSRNHSDINLILMDIQMPEMNGYEATRQIRHFNKEVVIIAQTAYSLAGDEEKAKEAGCNDYISKPIIKDKLLELIQKYFKK